MYSLALDKSSDINDTAQLALFIRGVKDDLSVHEYLLDLIPIKGKTTGKDLFEALRHCCVKKIQVGSTQASISFDRRGSCHD